MSSASLTPQCFSQSTEWRFSFVQDMVNTRSVTRACKKYCVAFVWQVNLLDPKRSLNVNIFLRQFKRWVSCCGCVHMTENSGKAQTENPYITSTLRPAALCWVILPAEKPMQRALFRWPSRILQTIPLMRFAWRRSCYLLFHIYC